MIIDGLQMNHGKVTNGSQMVSDGLHVSQGMA